jgi:vancomycin resistance protein VanW
MAWQCGTRRYAIGKIAAPLKYRHFKHTSKLIKQLGDSDMTWQRNKVHNLAVAISKISGILIHPQEHFSFCRLVGLPMRHKGYLVGMELSMGRARGGIGGGICQLSNVIHWLALHTDLQVVERSNHSFDPFPDDGRVLPFGSGAAIFYNYVDLVLFNPTTHTFQLNLWLTEKNLEGEVRSDSKSEVRFHVHEKNHKFIKSNGQRFRQNEIWRDKSLKWHNSHLISSEKMYSNFVRVMYDDTHSPVSRPDES